VQTTTQTVISLLEGLRNDYGKLEAIKPFKDARH